MHHDAASIRKLTVVLRRAPRWLRASAMVDLAHLLLGVRPAMRTRLNREVDAAVVRRWVRSLGYHASLDGDGFLVIARRPGLSARLLALDRAHGAHAHAFGLALGYPACCAKAAGRFGEAGIDAWSARIAARRFIGDFRWIDPSGYLQGRAVICHVPCSSRCAKSLIMARRLVRAQGGPLAARRRLPDGKTKLRGANGRWLEDRT